MSKQTSVSLQYKPPTERPLPTLGLQFHAMPYLLGSLSFPDEINTFFKLGPPRAFLPLADRGDQGKLEIWKISPAQLPTPLSFPLILCQWNDLIAGCINRNMVFRKKEWIGPLFHAESTTCGVLRLSSSSAQLQGSRRTKGLKKWTVEAGKPGFESWLSHRQGTEGLNEAHNYTHHLSLFQGFSEVISSPTRLSRGPSSGSPGHLSHTYQAGLCLWFSLSSSCVSRSS